MFVSAHRAKRTLRPSDNHRLLRLERNVEKERRVRRRVSPLVNTWSDAKSDDGCVNARSTQPSLCAVWQAQNALPGSSSGWASPV